MQADIITTTLLPLSLFVIMLGVGLSLTLTDFTRILLYPRAMLAGLTNQLILLPVIGYLLLRVFQLPPAMAVGFMILAACPGGPTSNLITHVSRGDTALSITLTAITSVVTVFTIPLITNWALVQFLGESQDIRLPFWPTIRRIIGITLLPVSLGMVVRHYRTALALRLERPARIFSTVLYIAILVGIIAGNWAALLDGLQRLGLATASLNAATMGLGLAAATLLRLNRPQTLSIVIESGIQNGTLAIVVATSLLFRPEMSLAAAVYSVFMFLSGGILMAIFGNRKMRNRETEKVKSARS
jgi:BASS family bile acid:Na+ symporter